MKTNIKNSVEPTTPIHNARHLMAPAKPKAHLLLTRLLLFLVLLPQLKADQITFQDGVNGYAGTHDTELSQANPNAVNGNLTSVSVDLEDPAPNWAQPLLKFSNIFGTGPNQIRPGTNIIVARLRLYTVNQGTAGPHIHRMLFDWDEATASWNSMNCCGNLTVGVQADDVDATTTDHDGDAVPGITFPNVGTPNTFTEVDVTADVQAWSDGAVNGGWGFIAAGGDGWDWVTSETGIVDQRPRLFVEFGTQDPPVFTLQPTNATVEQARTARFTVAAEGSLPLTYQWYKDDVAIDAGLNPSATTTTLTLVNVQETDNGTYHCNASNPIGNANSEPAVLTVEPDVTPPVMLGAMGSGRFDSVTVQFNEAMDPAATVDPFGWNIFSDQGGVAVASITLSSDGTIATILFQPGSVLAENTLYTVQNSGAADVTFNEMPFTSVTFQSFVSGCGSFFFEAFDTASTPGNLISLLTSHPNYPNNPMTVANISSWDTRHAYPDDTHNQYGGRIRGFFIPNVTGPWVFFHRSDDAGELWLNPNGTDPAGKQRIAVEAGCCGNFRPHGDPRTSAPFDLVAGQAYYMESLYKEGGGGDWLKVAAKLASEPVPTDGFGDANTAIDINAIPAGGGPAGVLNHITIATQPASQSRTAGQTAAFSVALSQDVPGCFQWKRDGADIPGAIGRNYRLTTSLADDGARFSVSVSLLGGTVLNSDEAILTVENDVTPPQVTSIAADVAGTNITIVYSEPMDPATTTATGNYSIAGITVQSATLANSTTLNLIVDPALNPCQVYDVAISGVRDVNNVAITPTNAPVVRRILLVDWDAATMWRYQDDGLEPVGDWKDRTYDDSGWLMGAALLGFEPSPVVAEAPLRTAISNATRTATAYFRTHFNLNTDPATVTSLQIRQIIDDGAVYYINGTEVYRSRIANGPVTHATFATGAGPESSGTIPTEGPFEAVRSSLRFGDNVLAVSLHATSGSSDSMFGATLSAAVTQCVTPLILSINRAGGSVTISANGAASIYTASSLDGPWTLVGPAPQTLQIDPQQAQVFFEAR